MSLFQFWVNTTRSSAMAEGLHDALVTIKKLAIDE